jgi:REP element-mobilizing transposase RayT
VAHRARPIHDAHHPVHATLRAQRALPSLREPDVFPVLRRALAKASRGDFRLVAFSVQTDHVHLVVEAANGQALRRGLQGFSIRAARRLNAALGRRGPVWADRYHARPLSSPREVRHGLLYVLQNWKKHIPAVTGLDPCSSAAWFSGFRDHIAEPRFTSPVVPPRTWLAGVGWRRHGFIGLEERPAARKRPRSRTV